MTVQLPEGVQMDDEIAIFWERDEDMARVIASLGDAKITVESTSEQGSHVAALLVQMLPSVLSSVYEAMAEEAEEEV